LLTFVVLPNAHVTVLTGGAARTRISAAELAQIVNGKNPRHRRLSERKAGFWLRIGAKYPNPAVTLDQQYQP
jgi:tRNA G18 (ribose-2'-O)-methylase SpoU